MGYSKKYIIKFILFYLIYYLIKKIRLVKSHSDLLQDPIIEGILFIKINIF